MLLPTYISFICFGAVEVAVSSIQDNVDVGAHNEFARQQGSSGCFPKAQRLAPGWGVGQEKQEQQMGCPISTCPVSSGQLPLPWSVSGPVFSPESPE